MVVFFILESYKCITKVKGCSFRNQEKVEVLKESASRRQPEEKQVCQKTCNFIL